MCLDKTRELYAKKNVARYHFDLINGYDMGCDMSYMSGDNASVEMLNRNRDNSSKIDNTFAAHSEARDRTSLRLLRESEYVCSID